MTDTAVAKPITLLGAIGALEAHRDQLFKFLDIPLDETEKILTETIIVAAKNRILLINSDLCNALGVLATRREQLREEFGEKLL